MKKKKEKIVSDWSKIEKYYWKKDEEIYPIETIVLAVPISTTRIQFKKLTIKLPVGRKLYRLECAPSSVGISADYVKRGKTDSNVTATNINIPIFVVTNSPRFQVLRDPSVLYVQHINTRPQIKNSKKMIKVHVFLRY